MVEQLKGQLQVEETKIGVAHEGIATLNRRDIEQSEQLEESIKRLEDLTEIWHLHLAQ